MYDENHFDYIIIGNGLAGLQLAMGLSKDPFFDTFKIALIDPSTKSINDKTWSFWEVGNGKWDSIVKKTWKNALFKSKNISSSLPLEPYEYKTIRSLDFYNYAKNELSQTSNFHFILDSIESIQEDAVLKIIGKNQIYTATHVFDSRIPKEFYMQSNHTLIHQHFKGIIIESTTACFHPDNFTMMDYRFQYQNTTSFIYVLPFSEHKALLEFTFFTPKTTAEWVYDATIEKYIKDELKIEHYQVLETEVGNIPMTDFPFWNYHSSSITKIGTGGGWVKASTGYSFKHTEKNIAKLIDNIKAGNAPHYKLFKKKYKFYDKIFLNVLKNENNKGPWIFERFYTRNSIETMFRFLDEETTFPEDLKIMKSLFSMAFIKAFFRVLFRR